MWNVCLFLCQIAICIFIIDCIFQMLKDFVPSNKTIFGAMAIVAGFIGLSRLKNYFNEINDDVEIHDEADEEKSK